MALDASPRFSGGRLAWRLASPLIVLAVGAAASLALVSYEKTGYAPARAWRAGEPQPDSTAILVRPYRELGWKIGAAAFVAAGALLAWRLRQIIRPLAAVDATLASIAGGAIARRVELEAAGEMGHFIEQVNRTLDYTVRRAVRWEALHSGIAQERQAQDDLRREQARLFAQTARELAGAAATLLDQVELLRLESWGRDEATTQILNLERDVAQLGDLAEGMVDIGLREAEITPLQKRRFCPREMIERVCEGLAPLAESRGLVIATEWKGRLPKFAVNDPTPARRVLGALIRNGLRLAQRGGVTLRIECHAAPTIEPFMQIDVIDTGPALETAQLAALFDPPLGERPTSISDSPLRGLALARRAATLIGGGLEGAAEPGKGSRFRFTFALGSINETDLVETPAASVYGESTRPRHDYRPPLPAIPVSALPDPLTHDSLGAYTATALMAAAFV